MVVITNGTIDWELTCERYALIGGTPPSGWTLKTNTCSNYARQFYAPFAAFGVGDGDGTVRSVALNADEYVFEVSGSPVTDVGTIYLALKPQAAKKILAGPVSGADAVPTFREIDFADLPASVIAGAGSSNELAYWDTDDTISHISKTYILPDEARFTDFALKLRTALSGVDFHIYSDADGGKLQTFGSMPLFINALGNQIKTPQLAGGTERIMFIATDGTLFGDALLASDIPNLPASIITSGILPIARGGTGLGTLGSALQLLRVNSAGTALEYFTLSTSGITGTLTATRIPYASGATTLADSANLNWDNANGALIVGSGAQQGKINSLNGTTNNLNAFFANANDPGTLYSKIHNVFNTGGGGNVAFWALAGGTSAGDPFVLLQISGGASWSSGVDNSDSDIFKIVPYSSPSGGAVGFMLTITGEAGINTAPVTALRFVYASGKPIGIPSHTTAQRAAGNANAHFGWNTDYNRLEAAGPYAAYYKPIISYDIPATTMYSAAGTGGYSSFSEGSNHIAGRIKITTGTGTTSGQIIRVAMSGNFGGALFAQLTAGNSVAAAQMNNFYVSASGTTYFDISVVTALAASTQYILYYRCDG